MTKRKLSSVVDPTRRKGRKRKTLSPKEKLKRRQQAKSIARRKSVADRVFDKGRSKVLHKRRTKTKSKKGRHKLLQGAKKAAGEIWGAAKKAVKTAGEHIANAGKSTRDSADAVGKAIRSRGSVKAVADKTKRTAAAVGITAAGAAGGTAVYDQRDKIHDAVYGKSDAAKSHSLRIPKGYGTDMLASAGLAYGGVITGIVGAHKYHRSKINKRARERYRDNKHKLTYKEGLGIYGASAGLGVWAYNKGQEKLKRMREARQKK